MLKALLIEHQLSGFNIFDDVGRFIQITQRDIVKFILNFKKFLIN